VEAIHGSILSSTGNTIYFYAGQACFFQGQRRSIKGLLLMWTASKTGLGLVYPGFKQINHFVCLASITKIGYSFLSSFKFNHAKRSSSRSAPLFVYVIQFWICLSHLCPPHAFLISSASCSESESEFQQNVLHQFRSPSLKLGRSGGVQAPTINFNTKKPVVKYSVE
jgi:hypothetical protein